MIIDITYFGYGVGLVMVGWLVGAVVGLIKRVLTGGVEI